MISRESFEKLEEIIEKEGFDSTLLGVSRIALEPLSNKKLDKKGYSVLELENIGEEVLLSILKIQRSIINEKTS